MIILDTCALIFDALMPHKLSVKAKKAIVASEKKKQLFCSDISLWEVSMLIHKKRIEIDTDSENFLRLMLEAKAIEILPITIEIANLSCSLKTTHLAPADRIIAATALQHGIPLITCDRKLQSLKGLSVIW